MTNSLEPSAVGEIVDVAGLGAAIVRPIQPDDAEALIRFHHRLSDNSIVEGTSTRTQICEPRRWPT